MGVSCLLLCCVYRKSSLSTCRRGGARQYKCYIKGEKRERDLSRLLADQYSCWFAWRLCVCAGELLVSESLFCGSSAVRSLSLSVRHFFLLLLLLFSFLYSSSFVFFLYIGFCLIGFGSAPRGPPISSTIVARHLPLNRQRSVRYSGK